MKTARGFSFRVLLFAGALAALSASGFAFAGESAGPLDRRLRLNLWGAGLADVARAVKEAAGVDIVFYLPDLPTGENTDNVYLVTGDVPLSAVLEALARRFAFRFRVAETGRVELSRGYGWVGREPVLRFARTDCLSGGECSPESERHFLEEFLKPLPLLAGNGGENDFSVRVEAYPLPGRPGALRAAAALPAALAEYFAKGTACLSGSAGDYPAAPRGTEERFFARAREERGAEWEELLTRAVYRDVRRDGGGGEDLRKLLADVAEQAGAAIALRAPPAGAEGVRLPADVAEYTFGRICETLSDDFGLGKRVFLSSGGVVFERGEEAGIEMDARSRELFWSGLAVAGFDAGRAAEAAGGGDALLRGIRREVFPGVWRDPVCAVVYSPVTERVAVVAPYNVVGKVGEFVSRAID